MNKIIFSGIQPSGALNIGGYLGALRNWVELQNQFDCFFSLVDLHTITVRQNPQQMREYFYDLLALYIACGINPEKSIIFCQSHVPQHAQLAWILNCYTYMGELNRMTQFKDKSKKHENNINVGLFTYPILMAADILLYNTNLVPVGEDQKQHVEITRDLALRFNNLYGEVFIVPEAYITKIGARIMSLQEPTKKMSKSDINTNGTLNLLDSTDMIVAKIKRAVTDSGSEIRFHEDKPGISNLLTIFSAITNKSIQQLEQEYQGQGYGKFKNDAADALTYFIKPIQQRYQTLRYNTEFLHDVLKKGAEIATQNAAKTLKKVHEAIGLIMV